MSSPGSAADALQPPDQEGISESAAVRVQLEGSGPFVLPFIGDEIAFGFGEDVAVMHIATTSGQEILVPFRKQTLRVLGLALAEALKNAFHDDPLAAAFEEGGVPDEIRFVEREGEA